MGSLTLLTYNIPALCLDLAADYEQRCQELPKTLEKSNFDIVLLQGVSNFTQRKIEILNKKYYHYFSYSEETDFTITLLRKDRFQDIETHEISYDPSRPSSMSLIIQAVDKKSNELITIFNTHIKENNTKKACQQLVQLNKKVKSLVDPHQRIVGGGSFKADPKSAPIKILKNKGFTIDNSDGYTITHTKTAAKTDHIFGKNVNFKSTHTVKNIINSPYKPLVATIELPPLKTNFILFKNNQPAGSFKRELMEQFKQLAGDKDSILLKDFDKFLTKNRDYILSNGSKKITLEQLTQTSPHHDFACLQSTVKHSIESTFKKKKRYQGKILNLQDLCCKAFENAEKELIKKAEPKVDPVITPPAPPLHDLKSLPLKRNLPTVNVKPSYEPQPKKWSILSFFTSSLHTLQRAVHLIFQKIRRIFIRPLA